MSEVMLADVERAARGFADAHDELAAIVRDLNDSIEAAKRVRLTIIKRAVGKAAQKHSELHALIDGARHLFTQPRTIVLSGVKVGLQKGKGGIEFTDAAQVVALIRKHLADRADVLIRTKESPNKEAIEELPVSDLKRIGCTIIESGDKIVIKPTDSEVDKIVAGLLSEAVEDATGQEAA